MRKRKEKDLGPDQKKDAENGMLQITTDQENYDMNDDANDSKMKSKSKKFDYEESASEILDRMATGKIGKRKF